MFAWTLGDLKPALFNSFLLIINFLRDAFVCSSEAQCWSQIKMKECVEEQEWVRSKFESNCRELPAELSVKPIDTKTISLLQSNNIILKTFSNALLYAFKVENMNSSFCCSLTYLDHCLIRVAITLACYLKGSDNSEAAGSDWTSQHEIKLSNLRIIWRRKLTPQSSPGLMNIVTFLIWISPGH